MHTQRYKMIIAYRGTAYHGWQKQPVLPSYKGRRTKSAEPTRGLGGIRTVQEVLALALAEIVGHPVKPVGSSRTDTGVHAKGQIVHFDTDKSQIPCEGLRRAVNHRLPRDVVIRSIVPVPDSFDAIRATTQKRYQYAIWHALDRPVFFDDLAWHRWKPLDVPAMKEAASLLVGEHDFASFARPGHSRHNTIRTVRECSIAYRQPRMVIGVTGEGFLWNMVRIMVGTLVEVGMGRYAPADIVTMLAARDRRAAGSTAPPEGLYLHWIKTTDVRVKTDQ